MIVLGLLFTGKSAFAECQQAGIKQALKWNAEERVSLATNMELAWS